MYFVDESPKSYATATDFCRIFTEELHSLYLLSLLLTADNDKAEKCFVSALSEATDGIGVSTEWAGSWARRAVLKHAIRMIGPAPEHSDSLPFIGPGAPPTSISGNPFATIFALDPFERFVFVMAILEGQSEQDCAILLRCSRRDVMIARVLALSRMASADAAYPQTDEYIKPGEQLHV
jgi:hypothetical protein